MKKAIHILVFLVAVLAMCLHSPMETKAASTSVSTYATTKSTVKITTQPKTARVKSGSTAKFTVAATGTGLKYQWQSSADGKTWKNCSSSSATSATFKFTAKTSHSSYYFRCRVTDSTGKVVYTSTVRLYVLGVATQPKTQKVKAGTTAKFTVSATGAGKTYQWQYSTDGKTWKNCSSSSATKATFTFTAKTSHSSNYYRCRIKDNGGNTVYTDTVRLYVLGITTQPKTLKIKAGATAKFAVSATGASKTYQWQYSTDGKTWKNCSSSSATTATFKFTAKTSHSSNYYRCRVKDSGGNTVYTDTVRMYVLGVTTQPKAQSVKEGEKVKFTVKATGAGKVYQWQYSADGTTWKNCSSSSATSATFTFTSKASHNGNYYRCRVKDNAGNVVYTNKVQLNVAFDAITITGPTGEVYGYAENARNYLMSGGDPVDRFRIGSQKNVAKPIDITWTSNFTADSFIVRYGTDANLANAKELTVSGTMNSVSVYNLLKSATYYVEISAKNGDGKTVVGTYSFTTSSIGPRVMNIDTLYNVRDVGGYTTSDGKVTKQNMIFRGDALKPCAQSTANLTEAGKAFMSQELGIKLEIDFRTPSEAQYDGTTSLIPGARLEYMTLGAYDECFKNASGYRDVFKALADINNYPVYMHCTGGADRTGTVVFLLNALLGVSYDDLVMDYEFTTFSYYGARDTQSGMYVSKFWSIEDGLMNFEGRTLAEQVESYLLRIGLTQQEVDNIKTIMKG